MLPEKKKDLGANPIRIRKATETDVNFIFSSWLKSIRNSGYSYGVPNAVFFSEHHKVIERLLKTCTVNIACSESDVSDIYGYICSEVVDGLTVIHFVYVKHTYRRLGIGNMLLNSIEHNSKAASLYTHMTKQGKLLEAKFNLVYSPYIALTPDYRKNVEVAAVTRAQVEELEQKSE